MTGFRGVIPRIKSVRDELPPNLRETAEFFLRNILWVQGHSLREVALAIGVSQASVVRMCQRAGFQGFRQLQLALGYELTDAPEQLQEEIHLSEKMSGIVAKVAQAGHAVIDDTRAMLDAGALEEIAAMIASRRRVILLAHGANVATAVDLQYNLRKLAIAVDVISDPLMQVVACTTASFADVVMAISYTGRNSGLIKALALAHEAGAATAAITALRGELDDAADIAVTVAPREIVFHGEPFSSRQSLLMINDILFLSVAIHDPDRLRALEDVHAVLKQQRDDWQ